jgi:hypothetical protein
MIKFESNRLTEGNKLFPTQLILTNKAVVIKKPGILSSEEKVIPYSQVTFIDVNTPLIGFSSVVIGTENQPITIGGFTRSEVKKIQVLVLEMI